MAVRIALSAASTGKTWRPVATWTSSIASTTVGSDRASVSVLPTLRTGNTRYFWTISLRTSFRISGSTSTRPRLMMGIPYLRLRKSRRSSSFRNPSRVRTVARRSPVRRCSAVAFWAWSATTRPSLTRSSSNRGFIVLASPRTGHPRERLIDQLDEAVETRSFLEERNRLVLLDLPSQALSDEAGDQDDRELGIQAPDRVKDDQPVHVRHNDVEHAELGLSLLEATERLAPRGRPDDLMTLKREHVIQHVQNRRGVVSDQDLCHVRSACDEFCQPPPGVDQAFSESGRSKTRVVPEKCELRARRPGPAPTREPQQRPKRLISLILKQDPVDATKTRSGHLGEVGTERADHRLSGLLGVHAPHPGPERGKGEAVETEFLSAAESRPGRSAHGVRTGPEVRAHDGGVDDVGGGQIAACGDHHVADLDGPLPHRIFLDDRASLPLDGRGDPCAHRELAASGVDDGIDLELGDVSPLEDDVGLPEPHLHRTLSWDLASAQSRPISDSGSAERSRFSFCAAASMWRNRLPKRSTAS